MIDGDDFDHKMLALGCPRWLLALLYGLAIAGLVALALIIAGIIIYLVVMLLYLIVQAAGPVLTGLFFIGVGIASILVYGGLPKREKKQNE